MTIPTSRNRTGVIEWIAIGISAALACLTIYEASVPVPGTDSFNQLESLWPVAAIAWAVAIWEATPDRTARVAAGIVAVASIIDVVLLGFPLGFALLLIGPSGLAIACLLATAIFLVILRGADSRRRLWFVPPAIVLSTLIVVYSGVPRGLRFAAAEPALSTFAEQVLRGDVSVDPYDDPVGVGSILIYQTVQRGNELLLVTAYIGIMGDDAAGLAYIPSGLPSGTGEYEHLQGPWYRWSPY